MVFNKMSCPGRLKGHDEGDSVLLRGASPGRDPQESFDIEDKGHQCTLHEGHGFADIAHRFQAMPHGFRKLPLSNDPSQDFALYRLRRPGMFTLPFPFGLIPISRDGSPRFRTGTGLTKRTGRTRARCWPIVPFATLVIRATMGQQLSARTGIRIGLMVIGKRCFGELAVGGDLTGRRVQEHPLFLSVREDLALRKFCVNTPGVSRLTLLSFVQKELRPLRGRRGHLDILNE